METFNYKVNYTYTSENRDFSDIKKSIVKASIKLAFTEEPSEYEIERKVKEWVDQLQRNGMDELGFTIEFDSIVKIKKLKVTKGLKDIDLSNL
jgi:hypothetical protein